MPRKRRARLLKGLPFLMVAFDARGERPQELNNPVKGATNVAEGLVDGHRGIRYLSDVGPKLLDLFTVIQLRDSVVDKLFLFRLCRAPLCPAEESSLMLLGKGNHGGDEEHLSTESGHAL